MNATKLLKGACSHCGGHFEYPVDAVGTTADCPHCGQSTELLLLADAPEPTVSRKTVMWTTIAVVILAGGLIGALLALNRAQRWAARRAAPAVPALTNVVTPQDPIGQAGFRAGPVLLEKVEGSKLVFAVGELSNLTDRQRFGVRVELELQDESGKKVGTARDYQQVLEPNGQWRFKAMVVEPKAKSATVVAVTEDL